METTPNQGDFDEISSTGNISDDFREFKDQKVGRMTEQIAKKDGNDDLTALSPVLIDSEDSNFKKPVLGGGNRLSITPQLNIGARKFGTEVGGGIKLAGASGLKIGGGLMARRGLAAKRGGLQLGGVKSESDRLDFIKQRGQDI